MKGFLDRPEPKARREWDEPFAGLFMKALESVVGDKGLSAAFNASLRREIFVHMQNAFRAMMVGKDLAIYSTNPLAVQVHDGDPGHPHGDSKYDVGFSDATTPRRHHSRHALRFSLSLSLSLSLQDRLRLFGEE